MLWPWLLYKAISCGRRFSVSVPLTAEQKQPVRANTVCLLCDGEGDDHCLWWIRVYSVFSSPPRSQKPPAWDQVQTNYLFDDFIKSLSGSDAAAPTHNSNEKVIGEEEGRKHSNLWSSCIIRQDNALTGTRMALWCSGSVPIGWLFYCLCQS